MGDFEHVNVDTLGNISGPQCRICKFAFEAEDDRIMDLGCYCSSGFGHQKCIMWWFGPRVFLQEDCSCDICNYSLGMDVIKYLKDLKRSPNGQLENILQTMKEHLQKLQKHDEDMQVKKHGLFFRWAQVGVGIVFALYLLRF